MEEGKLVEVGLVNMPAPPNRHHLTVEIKEQNLLYHVDFGHNYVVVTDPNAPKRKDGSQPRRGVSSWCKIYDSANQQLAHVNTRLFSGNKSKGIPPDAFNRQKGRLYAFTKALHNMFPSLAEMKEETAHTVAISVVNRMIRSAMWKAYWEKSAADRQRGEAKSG